MSMIRRLIAIGIGVAAGAVACKLLKDMDKPIVAEEPADDVFSVDLGSEEEIVVEAPAVEEPAEEPAAEETIPEIDPAEAAEAVARAAAQTGEEIDAEAADVVARIWEDISATTAAPNANPVELGTADKPVDADGKLDPTRIASPEDFANWDDLGCQG
ncbi:MAG: hypothetical protein IJ484_09455 [Oscillospiraceae bacterium]|nr:hypothetical protein [Oscillospiraceae bacterium]